MNAQGMKSRSRRGIRSLVLAWGLALASLAWTTPAAAQFPRGNVSLDLRESDVRDVLMLFANQYKLNVIVGEDVTGKVTLILHEVPIRTAFTSILSNAGLGFRQEGSILRVNTMKTIAENKAIEPLVTRVVTLNYFTTNFGSSGTDVGSVGYSGGTSGDSGSGSGGGSQRNDGDDLGQLKTSLEKHLSGTAGASITVVPRTNSIIVTDIASNVDRVVALAKSLDVETPQILIEAKIFEVDANYSRSLGVRTALNGFRSGHTTAGGGTASNLDATGVNVTQTVVDGVSQALVGPGGGVLGGFIANDNFNLSVVLSAAETEGKARQIGSPKVATLNNKEAVISSGQRIPFTTLGSVAAQGGTNLVATVEFIDAALELAVTPHVTGDGNVMMRVRASRNSADFSNTVFQNPTINTREARNEVLVRDGETIVIGGIYTEDEFGNHDGVPYLQDVPVLGHLFKAKDKMRTQTELVFLVTPHVVSSPAVLHASPNQAGLVDPEQEPEPAYGSVPATEPKR